METNQQTPETEYELVYQAITAVGARCDGALALDQQGFNGQDAKFGARICAMPYSEWTPQIKEEAAKMCSKYQGQVRSYTGIDAPSLAVVREASHRGTNYAARQQAREYAWKSKRADQAKNSLSQRVVGFADGWFSIQWANGDPEFGLLLDGVKGLPRRRWDAANRRNIAPHSIELETYVSQHDFTLTEAALVELQREAPKFYEVRLGDGTIIFDVSYNWELIQGMRGVPGHRFLKDEGSGRINHLPPCRKTYELVSRFDLSIDPLAEEVLRLATQKEDTERAASQKRADILISASRCGHPANLTPQFLELLATIEMAPEPAERPKALPLVATVQDEITSIIGKSRTCRACGEVIPPKCGRPAVLCAHCRSESAVAPKQVAAKIAKRAAKIKQATHSQSNLCRQCGRTIPPTGKPGRPAAYHEDCRPEKNLAEIA